MIRSILLILFIGLFMLNSHICTYFYPSHGEDYAEFVKWYYLRDQIYEVMFLIAVCVPFTKPSRISRAIAVFGFMVILASVSDKLFMNRFTTVLSDWMVVVPAAIFVATLIYRKSNVQRDT